MTSTGSGALISTARLQLRRRLLLPGSERLNFFTRRSFDAASRVMAAWSSIAAASSGFSFAFPRLSALSHRASGAEGVRSPQLQPPYVALQLKIVTSNTPGRRARSAVVAPASASFSTAMIRSSLILVLFILSAFLSAPDTNRTWRKTSGHATPRHATLSGQ